MRKTSICVLLLLLGRLALAQSATQLGTPLSTGAGKQVAMALHQGIPYVAYTAEADERYIHLMRFKADSWEELGQMPEEAKSGDPLQLQFQGDTPLILYANGYGMTLARFKDEQWDAEGKPNFAANLSVMDPKLCFVGDQPYIVYENKSDKKIDMHTLVKQGNVHIWTTLDAMDKIPSGAEQPGIATDLSGAIYLSWFDRKNEAVGFSKVINDGQGLLDMSKGIPAKDVSQLLGIKAIGNQLYLAYEDKKNGYGVQIMGYNASKTKWEPVAGITAMTANHFTMLDDLSLVSIADDGAILIQKHIDGGGWEAVETLGNDHAETLSASSAEGVIYIAFLDAKKGNQVVLKKR